MASKCCAVAVLALGLSACAAPHTQVHTFLPTAMPARAQVAGGSCWTHSIAAPERPDAWRCAVGNRIEDPCFEVAGSQDLLCGANPAAPTKAEPIALELTLPLPDEALPSQAATQPWLVELSDGALCRPFTGTRPVTAGRQAGSYGCSSGRIIVGDLSRSASRRWMALTGILNPTASGPPKLASRLAIAIRAVWQ